MMVYPKDGDASQIANLSDLLVASHRHFSMQTRRRSFMMLSCTNHSLCPCYIIRLGPRCTFPLTYTEHMFATSTVISDFSIPVVLFLASWLQLCNSSSPRLIQDSRTMRLQQHPLRSNALFNDPEVDRATDLFMIALVLFPKSGLAICFKSRKLKWVPRSLPDFA